MWGKLKVWPDSQRDRTNSWRKGASVVASFVPTQIEADSSTQEERQHGINSENVEHPSASFKLFHPAKPSPSFLELPFTQRRPSRGHRCIQAVRLGHKQFSPDHQPQECMGLLECMHNHLQIQTKMVQAQFSLGKGRRVGSSREMKLFVLAVCALLSVAHSEEGARLLASKSLLNRYAVEGKDLTLQYNIYNVGSSAALDVELSDDSFPPEDFGIVSGMLSVKWDRIAPASNVSHTVVLRPLKAGYFNFTSATIAYLAQEGGQVVIGFTSAPGQGGILAQREFDRRFSPHFLDWAAFGVMTLPSIGIPLLLWYSSKRKYDTPKTKKN
ncbi:TSSK6-activating co-chaperone protein [Alligator mississippiensis]|uniref:TSSK6-activating co-chaperone protein n=1 Tax=Alligator mississippiensis TaxID=8496 RepID=A0A151NZB2_ALLMI|nr:TSSK6-activating co-chaperone protein [Alligator mississippiensis]